DDVIGRQIVAQGGLLAFLQLGRVEVGAADCAYLALLFEPTEGGKRFFVCGLLVWLMCEIEIDVIGAQSLQGSLYVFDDPLGRKSGLAALAVIADLDDDDGLVSCDMAALQPLFEDGLALSANMAVYPGGVDIGR